MAKDKGGEGVGGSDVGGNVGGNVVIIKKYANRRLYDTESSSYITLEHLAAMTRGGREFKVVDAKTDEDLTHTILTQIIMEEESRGTSMLPVNFLRQLIAMYGDSMQAMVPGYLDASMDSFRRNQAQFRSAVEGAFVNNPFAEMAKRNMAMLETAAEALVPKKAAADDGDEIAALKAQLAELQGRIDKLSR